ncbi:MAG: hypothetical protein VB025_00945 [Sphaerochaeta sp.]|jgi:biopolymer transport protein ExbD|nr:hypothetical protein [Sphaerochaeta sp.]PKL27432.1 MAG: hypothetical protein CVV46_11785 [Spirochaetae bacterium HGW-Spirochaetae-2]
MRRKQHTVGQPGDIAFLLIIFFLVLIGLQGARSIELSVGGQSAPDGLGPLSIVLLADGTILQEGSSIPMNELSRIIAHHDTLHLQVAGETVWQDVVTVLSLADKHRTAVSLEVLR